MNIDIELKEVIFLIILIIASITDYHKKEVPNNIVFLAIIIGLYLNLYSYFYILVSLIFFIVFIFIPLNGMGGGDKKLLALIPLFLNSDAGKFFFILSILYLMIYSYIILLKKQKKTIIFVPAILLAYILTIIFFN